ncbi:MAG: HutD family protein [Clostridia bacterium]|nr:HutD family protein [Clostridia bacterium]
MNIRILDPLTRSVTNWSGGKTTELYLYPADGSYAERRFLFRISSASVDLPESRFTRLEGVTRYLTPLSEGFYLKRNGQWNYLGQGNVLCFSGEDDILCRGSGRDLNLMLKGARGELRVLPAGDHALTLHAFLFLYCAEETVVSGTVVPEDSFLEITSAGFSTLHLSRPAVLFSIDV